ncbi:MATE family efflux transporter [Butyrivibrio sp. AC2005]|uniref:MATE family efflux transporter n=1 Tax=Butyrivibrio sp. AC2005 TaxID=1280672 RepID=UPI000401225A|nr:MATE family efflux transporter [Butyrivibrio sp. AC2005]
MRIYHKPNDILKKLFIQLVVVNSLIGLLQPCNQLIDSVLTGQMLGTYSLKVYALILPVGSLVMALSFVFSIGTQISVSNMIGKGKVSEAEEYFHTSLRAATLFACVFAAIVFIFSRQIVVFLGASASVEGQISDSSDYLRAYAVGIPAIFLMNIMLSMLQLEGQKKLVVILSFFLVIVNATGDLMNLFVFSGGLLGMAMATSISYITIFAGLVLYYLKFSRMFTFSLKNFNVDCLIGIVKNGLPSFAYYGSIVVRTAFFNRLALTIPFTNILAIMAVVNSFTTIVDAVIGGIGDTVLLLGGVLHGEKDLSGQKSLLQTAVLYGGSLLLLMSILSGIFAVPIAGIFAYKDDRLFVQDCARAIRLTSICFLPDTVACIFKKYIQSIGRAKYTAITNVLCNVIYVGTAAYVLVNLLGSDGIFFSYTVCYVLMLFTHFLYAFYIAKGSFKSGVDIFLFQPQDRLKNIGRIHEYQIKNIDECVEVSKEIYEICLREDIVKRKALYMSLFTEEMVKNVLQHGVRKDNQVRILLKIIFLEDEIILNVKDNCIYFDPMNYYHILQENGNDKSGFGIRIVMGLAKEVTYTNSFNLNNLFVRLSNG